LGHVSVTTTEIYGRPRHDLFAEKAFDAVTCGDVDLSKPEGNVVSLRGVSGPIGHEMATTHQDTEERKLAKTTDTKDILPA
jgi:hypothetical protein